MYINCYSFVPVEVFAFYHEYKNFASFKSKVFYSL